VDDNFSTILPAVEEGYVVFIVAFPTSQTPVAGKSMFHNIQNFLSFQLSTRRRAHAHHAEHDIRLSNPLNAMQILFINILMDGERPAFSLTF